MLFQILLTLLCFVVGFILGFLFLAACIHFAIKTNKYRLYQTQPINFACNLHTTTVSEGVTEYTVYSSDLIKESATSHTLEDAKVAYSNRVNSIFSLLKSPHYLYPENIIF